MNRNYGKLNEGKITYAPETLYIDGKLILAPRAEHFAAAGYSPIDNTKPDKIGVYFVQTEFGDLVDGVIRRRFDERPIVAPQTVYVVEEIIYQLIAAQKLQPTKAVVGDYWELLTMRERIEADNEIWGAAFPQVCSGLIAAGVFESQAEIDALLVKCREGYVDDESGLEVR